MMYLSFTSRLKCILIRMVHDNHSAHTSIETQTYLNTIPGRFEFVFTPTHRTWLNIIEGFFSKMTRQMLTRIRVETKEDISSIVYGAVNTNAARLRDADKRAPKPIYPSMVPCNVNLFHSDVIYQPKYSLSHDTTYQIISQV